MPSLRGDVGTRLSKFFRLDVSGLLSSSYFNLEMVDKLKEGTRKKMRQARQKNSDVNITMDGFVLAFGDNQKGRNSETLLVTTVGGTFFLFFVVFFSTNA